MLQVKPFLTFNRNICMYINIFVAKVLEILGNKMR